MKCEIAFMRDKKRSKEFYDFNYIFNIIDVVLIRTVNSNAVVFFHVLVAGAIPLWPHMNAFSHIIGKYFS
jgi:hypothetical protein